MLSSIDWVLNQAIPERELFVISSGCWRRDRLEESRLLAVQKYFVTISMLAFCCAASWPSAMSCFTETELSSV